MSVTRSTRCTGTATATGLASAGGLEVTRTALEVAGGHQPLHNTSAFRALNLFFAEDELFEVAFTFAAAIFVYRHVNLFLLTSRLYKYRCCLRSKDARTAQYNGDRLILSADRGKSQWRHHER
jgi:hypothetical protein